MVSIEQAIKCKWMTLLESKKVACGNNSNSETYCKYDTCTLWEPKEEEKKIDHVQTSKIVCPYCGHVLEDSYEYPDEMTDCECPNCEESFSYERYVSITYTSYK